MAARHVARARALARVSTENVRIVRELFHAWNERGELPPDERIASNFELRSPISREHGEPYRGLSGAHAWMHGLNERFPGFHFELEALEEHGQCVLALGQLAIEGRGTAAGLSHAEGWLFELAGGRLVALEVFTDQAAALKAARDRASQGQHPTL